MASQRGQRGLLAIQQKVPVIGLCLYPIADYPGWDDGRHCRCGLIRLNGDWSIQGTDPSTGHALQEIGSALEMTAGRMAAAETATLKMAVEDIERP